MAYNYRNMHTSKMRDAIEACKEAGIGLTAMKTQAVRQGRQGGKESDRELQMVAQFTKKGFTPEQAKLMLVWEKKEIASICSQMTNLTILEANVAAALNRFKLSSLDKKILEEYAQETRSSYCAGCASLCEPTLGNQIPIRDVMRYLMYYQSYGEQDMARGLYTEIPQETRSLILSSDYTEAERKCPQGLAIGRLMKEASEIFMV
jgi:predicted aldo/keto reductase-like oxidoreductase